MTTTQSLADDMRCVCRKHILTEQNDINVLITSTRQRYFKKYRLLSDPAVAACLASDLFWRQNFYNLRPAILRRHHACAARGPLISKAIIWLKHFVGQRQNQIAEIGMTRGIMTSAYTALLSPCLKFIHTRGNQPPPVHRCL